jgi:fructose-1,6-bisphosphatase/inositol monophosphatase family enzyme
MKAPLKSRRPTPDEALAIATSTAPLQPPTQIAEPQTVLEKDMRTTLNLRVRSSTITALMKAARGRGLTMKQVVCQALDAAGVAVALADLEDRTPRRR